MTEEIFYVKVIKGKYTGYVFQVRDKSDNFLKINNCLISSDTINIKDVIPATEKEFNEFNEKHHNQEYPPAIFI